MLKAEGAGASQALEAQHAVLGLESALARATQVGNSLGSTLPSWQGAWEQLQELEASMHTEMRYVYGLDWDVKPGKLISKKGTWLKPNTRFSWELADGQKLYMPQGIVMPVLQISRVTDAEELKRHEWVAQHLRVWLKPAIVDALEGRRATWFVYLPHWEQRGTAIAATADTWLKRTTRMSGDLQPFELIHVSKGRHVQLQGDPCPVEEEWEKFRHQYVHLHRKVVLASAPVTVKRDQYDVFVGQGDDRLHAAIGLTGQQPC